MYRRFYFFIAFLIFCQSSFSQETDSLDTERLARMVDLSEVVVRSDLNVARFIAYVKNDTTFYKAFRTLHVLGYSALNDIRIKDKKGKLKASLQSKIRQN